VLIIVVCCLHTAKGSILIFVLCCPHTPEGSVLIFAGRREHTVQLAEQLSKNGFEGAGSW
jgi:hypothetical protein